MSTREVCDVCHRPVVTCLCDAICQQHPPTQLIIWQDPTEAKHRLSTTLLVQLNFPECRVLVADEASVHEVFSEGTNIDEVALVYPMTHKTSLDAQAVVRVKTLLVLDGTWRKVRRLLHLNPWLHELPHLALEPEHTSVYAIRQSPREDGLSTLEACVAALHQVEQHQHYQPALDVLKKLVRLQQSYGAKS